MAASRSRCRKLLRLSVLRSLTVKQITRIPRFAQVTRSESDFLYEAEGRRVHAVAEVGGSRAVVEDMAEVGVAFGAGDSRAFHTDTGIARFGDILARDWSPEAGPSGPGVKFRSSIEQRIFTANAAIDALVMQVPVFSGKSEFGVGVARDVVGISRELLAPLIRSLDHLGYSYLFQALAHVGVEDDGDVFRFASGSSRFQRDRSLPLPQGKAGKYGGRCCEECAPAQIG